MDPTVIQEYNRAIGHVKNAIWHMKACEENLRQAYKIIPHPGVETQLHNLCEEAGLYAKEIEDMEKVSLERMKEYAES